MPSFLDPVQLVSVVPIARIVAAEQFAIGRDGEVEGVAKAPCDDVSAGAQCRIVVLEQDVGSVRGEAENQRRERHFTHAREQAVIIFDLAVIRARATVDEERLPVRRNSDAVETVIKVDTRGVRHRVRDARPDPRVRLVPADSAGTRLAACAPVVPQCIPVFAAGRSTRQMAIRLGISTGYANDLPSRATS